MSDPNILTRASIAADASLAAQRAVAHGVSQPNPHALCSDAAQEWDRRYHIALLRHSAIEGTEASA